MKITDVKVQVKNKNKVSVFVDGEYYDSLFGETYVKSDLSIGIDISEEDFIEIKTASQSKMAFDKALDYLSHRMRSEHEVREYLKKKEFCESAIDYAIVKLIEYKYINDYNFAKALLKDRTNIKKRGRQHIKNELRKYRIDPDTIEEVLETYTYEDELELAIAVAQKMKRKYAREENKYKRRQKIASAMARQGYNWDIISSAVEYEEEE